MRNSIFKYIVGLLLFVVTTAKAEGTKYYAALTVSASPTGAGTVYVESPGTITQTKEGTKSTDVSFTVGATPSQGYRFSKWDVTGTGCTVVSSTQINVQASGSENGINSATATAVFVPNTYTIAFGGNGAESGSTASINATCHEHQTLPGSGY